MSEIEPDQHYGGGWDRFNFAHTSPLDSAVAAISSGGLLMITNFRLLPSITIGQMQFSDSISSGLLPCSTIEGLQYSLAAGFSLFWSQLSTPSLQLCMEQHRILPAFEIARATLNYGIHSLRALKRTVAALHFLPRATAIAGEVRLAPARFRSRRDPMPLVRGALACRIEQMPYIE